jgi:hypothetical protein
VSFRLPQQANFFADLRDEHPLLEKAVEPHLAGKHRE